MQISGALVRASANREPWGIIEGRHARSFHAKSVSNNEAIIQASTLARMHEILAHKRRALQAKQEKSSDSYENRKWCLFWCCPRTIIAEHRMVIGPVVHVQQRELMPIIAGKHSMW